MASGYYVAFLEPRDWFSSLELLYRWLEYTDSDKYDCCISEYIQKNDSMESVGSIVYGESKKTSIWEYDFHNAIYKKSFLISNKIKFDDYSILTGFDFWTKVIFKAPKIGFFKEYVYCQRKSWKQDWLKTEKCELILNCIDNLVKLSLEEQNPFLHCKLFHMLNSDVLKKIIVNGTKIYHMSAIECPNGENGQIKTLVYLYSIMQNANTEMLNEGGFDSNEGIMDILYEVINERQKFLSNL